MPTTPTIIPATAAADLGGDLFSVIGANSLAILGVIGLAVGISFAVRWFTKSTKRIRP